ncbi:hypothetical protein EJ08DRAFT_694740 [Tothia fuscella]|uniref:Uncharacterized protein n=1 Tax=Tothia fuscella TaxID=1048955 RepID=A0A9P4NVI5_9PEZI|nr:hypothetical protein EJ08DRAFT_694740 [Tothia fuscella]
MAKKFLFLGGLAALASATGLTLHDYPSTANLPKHGDDSPGFCEMPYSSLDLSHTTAKCFIGKASCGECLNVCGTAGCQYMLVVDRCDRAQDHLDISIAAGPQIVGSDTGIYSGINSTVVEQSLCSGFWTGKMHPYASPAALSAPLIISFQAMKNGGQGAKLSLASSASFVHPPASSSHAYVAPPASSAVASSPVSSTMQKPPPISSVDVPRTSAPLKTLEAAVSFAFSISQAATSIPSKSAATLIQSSFQSVSSTYAVTETSISPTTTSLYSSHALTSSSDDTASTTTAVMQSHTETTQTLFQTITKTTHCSDPSSMYSYYNRYRPSLTSATIGGSPAPNPIAPLQGPGNGIPEMPGSGSSASGGSGARAPWSGQVASNSWAGTHEPGGPGAQVSGVYFAQQHQVETQTIILQFTSATQTVIIKANNTATATPSVSGILLQARNSTITSRPAQITTSGSSGGHVVDAVICLAGVAVWFLVIM